MTLLLKELDAQMRKAKRELFKLSGYGYDVYGHVQNNMIQFDAIKTSVAHEYDDLDVCYDAARLRDKERFDSELPADELKWRRFIAIMLESNFELVLLGKRLCVVAQSKTVGWMPGPPPRPRRSLFVLCDHKSVKK